MHDNNAEDINSSFVDKKSTQPVYLQRSVSAPAIAEHVSEAVIPTFALEQNDVDVSGGMLNSIPSRLNPRIPTYKKDMGGEDMPAIVDITSSLFHESQKPGSLSLLDETMGGNALSRDILNSLMADGQRPLDLIQADFPGTPSSIFSKHRLAAAKQDNDANSGVDGSGSAGGDASPHPLPASSRLTAFMSSTASNEDALEEAAKSLQKLYVNPENAMSGAMPAANPLLAQYTAMSGPNAALPANYFPAQAAMNQGLLGANAAFANTPKPMSSATSMSGETDLSFSLASANGNVANMGHGMPGFMPSPGVDLSGGLGLGKFANNGAGMNNFTPMMMMMGNNGMQNAYNPLMAANGNPAAFSASFVNNQVPVTTLNPQQPPYYPQQQLYVNNNGQTVYYRPASNGNNYGQEFVYTANAVEGGVSVGSQMMMTAPDQNMMQMQGYMQYPANQMHAGFWAGGGGDQNQMPMFIPAGQQVRMEDPNNRMVFQQQYSMNNMQAMNNNMMTIQSPNGQYVIASPAPMNNRSDMSQNDNSNRYDNDMNNRNNRDHNGGNNRHDNGNHGSRGNQRGVGKNNPVNGNGQARDSLVEEFRTTFGKSRQWSLRDLAGHVVAFCQDQHGSRFIQQRLEICTDVEKQLVFDEILPSAQVLMTDVFGNYVLQKIFEYGNPDQCEALALLLKGQAVQLSMQMYGCRVVQKALEYVSTERLIDLVTEFEDPQMLIRCVHDSNGNHVIQKCIEVVSKAAKAAEDQGHADYLSSRIQFIIIAFNGKVKELSSHPYGCRVVQRILEHCTEPQKAVILEELRLCCGELVQDCYGNYVIQFVMQHGWEEDRAALIREVQTNLLDFSQHKFASNVVEKCLQFANKKDRDEMIWTIINVTFDLNNPVDAKGHCVLESMVRDPYANYVVQKVIDVSDERQRGAIMRYVKDNIHQLRKYTYGKHIIVRLEKITNEKF